MGLGFDLDRLFFATLDAMKKPRSSANAYYFSTDEDFVYARPVEFLVHYFSIIIIIF